MVICEWYEPPPIALGPFWDLRYPDFAALGTRTCDLDDPWMA